MCKCRCNISWREAPTGRNNRRNGRGTNGRTDGEERRARACACVEQSRTNLAIHREYERNERKEEREKNGRERRGNEYNWLSIFLVFPLRFVPQVESFQRILCGTGALIRERERERERESTLRNESGVDGINKGGGGDSLSLSLSHSLSLRQTRVPCLPNYVSVASAAGS